MSRADFIDLTGDSDDESRTRNNNNVRSQPKPIPSQSRLLFNDPNYHRIFSDPSPSVSSAPLIPAFSLARHPNNSSIYPPYPTLPNQMRFERRQNTTPTHRDNRLSEGSMRNREVPRHPPVSKPKRDEGSPRPKVQKRACVNCAEVNVTCDGERPCSACVEPGLLCYYPGEKPANRAVEAISIRSSKPKPKPPSRSVSADHRSHKSTPDGNAPRFASPATSSTQLTKQSDLLPNLLLNPETSRLTQNAMEALVDEEAFDDSDDSDDEVPSGLAEIEEVKRLLRKHEARMRDHRAYLLQPLLNQAKLDASKAPTPDLKPGATSPFVGLVSKTRLSSNVSPSKSSVLHVQMRSNKPGAPKKWTQLSTPLKVVKTNPTILPKYKSIGRLGTSILTPNIRTLKYWPYFPDEESLDPSEAKKNEELEERYQHDDNHLLAQRKCSELVDMWQPWVTDFVSRLQIEFSDILYWFLHTTEKTTCDTCEREILAEAFQDVSRLLPKPNEHALNLARLSAMALKEVAKISMWHFVLSAPSVKDLTKQMELPKKNATTLCSICFLHNCLSHGAYQEPEESGGAVIMGGNVEINDEEVNHNIRVSAAVPNNEYDGIHQCGLYCVAAEARVKDLLGRKREGVIGGIHNHAVHVPRISINNDVTCGENCYWPIEKRTKFGTVAQTKDYQPKLSDKSKALFRQLLRIYSDNQRAPCMIAKDIDGLACIDAFYYMLAETQRVSHYRQALANAAQQGTRKISKLAAGLDTTLSADLDERPPFVPCSHPGPCLNNPDCTCAQDKVHCEWFCGCDKSCERRFPGCKCASTNKTCFNDKNCECWKHNRECDPWVCGTCGVVEVLDPQNKYKEEIHRGRCKNNRIQLDLPARTVKAPSEVQGWGLYAGVDLEEQTFIGEYKGETVGNQESDRRGAVYANIGQEYLFVMNRDQQIDGSNFGNKTRFINNSQRDDYINVFAKKLLCNGVQRVMLYAKKPIKAGEELLYNYNYPVSVTKKFWERGEGPTNVPGAVVVKPSITWTQPRVNGRFAKVAGKQDGEQPPTARVTFASGSNTEVEDAAAKRDAKRKRASEGDLSVVTEAPVNAKASGPKEAEKSVVAFPDDPEDLDFELVDPSESSESVDEAEADSDPGEGLTTIRRRRVVHPHDRRRGGLAQAKAWETRRKRNGKGK